MSYGQGDWADAPAPIDPATGRLFPFAEGKAVFIADFAGEIGRLSARNLLKTQLARAADMGFPVTAGFEYEFFVLDETPASVRQDLMAAFMTKWSNETNGQSGHTHISLQTAEGGHAFHDPDAPHGMSATMRHFVGGLVPMLPETLAMCSHTMNAYRCMVPRIWAPITVTWGVQNRTSAVRNHSRTGGRDARGIPRARGRPLARLEPRAGTFRGCVRRLVRVHPPLCHRSRPALLPRRLLICKHKGMARRGAVFERYTVALVRDQIVWLDRFAIRSSFFNIQDQSWTPVLLR